jgi:hypothetical protein
MCRFKAGLLKRLTGPMTWKGTSMTWKGNDLEGYINDLEGYINDLEGYINDLEGFINDLEGYINDLEGFIRFCEDLVIPKKKVNIIPSNIVWVSQVLKELLNQRKGVFKSGGSK